MGINLPRGEARVNVRAGSARWNQLADQVPMPRFLTYSRTRVLQGLVLEARSGKANGAAVDE